MVANTPEDSNTEPTKEEEKVTETSAEPITAAPAEATAKPVHSASQPSRFKRLIRRYWAKKAWTLPITLIAIVGIIGAVPFTRYLVLGTFLRKDFTILVVDSKTKKPVTNATVELGGATKLTDNKGQVTLHVNVGTFDLSVRKKYYITASADVLVPLNQKGKPYTISLKATGRQVPVAITNKITGKPLADVLVKAGEAEGKTDKDGMVTMVLPADKATMDATFTADGYVSGTGTIQVTERIVTENSFAIVPVGKVYFLSRLSGKIDVVKTNLDGSDRQTVLAGTGSENQTDTVLLASRDWKYLTLKSRRDGGAFDKLFLIDTSNDKLTTMDEGDATFTLDGWSGHHFVYQVGRSGYASWQPKAQALKAYNAETAKITTLDETTAEGSSTYDYAFNSFGAVYILGDEIVYNKNWYAGYYSSNRINDKQVNLASIKSDGSGRKAIKDFPTVPNTTYANINLSFYEPQGIYVEVPGTPNTYYEYEDGKLTAKPDITDDTFSQPYPTYLVSPSNNLTFWSEARDGKNSLFVGDADGANAKQVATLSEYIQYGWYSDDYLLVSKNGSELYIMPVGGGDALKISDYHKPDISYGGYGGGYGGF